MIINTHVIEYIENNRKIETREWKSSISYQKATTVTILVYFVHNIFFFFLVFSEFLIKYSQLVRIIYRTSFKFLLLLIVHYSKVATY